MRASPRTRRSAERMLLRPVSGFSSTWAASIRLTSSPQGGGSATTYGVTTPRTSGAGSESTVIGEKARITESRPGGSSNGAIAGMSLASFPQETSGGEEPDRIAAMRSCRRPRTGLAPWVLESGLSVSEPNARNACQCESGPQPMVTRLGTSSKSLMESARLRRPAWRLTSRPARLRGLAHYWWSLPNHVTLAT
jgi:hypothetical protein